MPSTPVPVAPPRFLNETGQELVIAQMRSVLANQLEYTPSLQKLKPHRLVLVPTALTLEPDQPSRQYAVELETVPSVELTHFEAYRILIGFLEIDPDFETTYAAQRPAHAALS